MTTKKSAKTAAPNGRVTIDVSAIEWGVPEPEVKRTGQWHRLLTQFVERDGEAGLIPCPGYSKKYLSVVASEMRNGKGAAKDFPNSSFDVRVMDAADGLGLWVRHTTKKK